MPRRGRSAPPISLFSFQDIITSVAGVIILITLLMAVELLQRKLSQTPVAQTSKVAPLRQELSDAIRERDRLRSQVQSQSADANELATVAPQELEQLLAGVEGTVRRLEQELRTLNEQQRLAENAAQQAQAASAPRNNERRKLADLKREIQQKQDEIDRLQRENRVIYNPTVGDAKQAWLVDVSPDKLLAAALGKVAPPRGFPGTSFAARNRNLMTWAKGRDPAREYFVLMIRPSAIQAFESLQNDLQAAGFDIGYDCLTDDVVVVDPSRGAAYE